MLTSALTQTGSLTVLASGTIEMNENVVGNIGAPVSNGDAATKQYVDDALSSVFTLTDGTTNQTIADGDTLTVAGTANEVEVAVSATDTLTIGLPDDVTVGNDLTVTGNLTVNGTTTTVNTTTSTLQDPIFQLGRGADDAALSADDNKDRGITMYYYDGSEKFAYMGWDNSASTMSFYADASNTGEVISGTKAALDAASLAVSATVTATGNITGGNLITSALVSAADVTATGTVTGGTLTDGTASITGGAATGLTQVVVDNLTLDGADITSDSGEVTVNDAGADVDFRVEGDTNTHMLFVDAGSDAVLIGGSSVTTDASFKVATTDSMMPPVGNTAQRPGTGVVGMLRFNTTTDSLEQYSNTDGWESVGAPAFTVIASETFDGDNSTVAFTLSDSQTTASCIVSINGVVQLPTTAYGVSGTTLTFTEAPLSGDKIEVRKVTTTTTLTNLSSTSGGATVELNNEEEVDVKGNLMPAADATYSIGNATVGWTTVYAEATSAQYADLAEKYEADAEYEAGVVLHFGGDKEVSECDQDHCTKVAGVVSTSPAYAMNDGLEAEHTVYVALQGRVPTKVQGPVAKGDMMVSAGNGKARAEADPKVGAVIGKALEDFNGEEGVIEVVVGKH